MNLSSLNAGILMDSHLALSRHITFQAFHNIVLRYRNVAKAKHATKSKPSFFISQYLYITENGKLKMENSYADTTSRAIHFQLSAFNY